MEAVREIAHVHERRVTLTVPAAMDDRDVEVIILPVQGTAKPARRTPGSLRGRLKAYANPAFICEEPRVWGTAAGE